MRARRHYAVLCSQLDSSQEERRRRRRFGLGSVQSRAAVTFDFNPAFGLARPSGRMAGWLAFLCDPLSFGCRWWLVYSLGRVDSNDDTAHDASDRHESLPLKPQLKRPRLGGGLDAHVELPGLRGIPTPPSTPGQTLGRGDWCHSSQLHFQGSARVSQ